MNQVKEFTKERTLVMKGIGIILIYIHHLFLSADVWNGKEVRFLILSQERVFEFAGFAKVCVSVFIFLTAYGMTCRFRKTQSDRGLSRYIAKRYFTLLSAFFFVFLFTNVLLIICNGFKGLVYQGTPFMMVLNWIFDAMGIAYFYGLPTLNATWWYMPVAFSAILLIPILWKVYKILGIMMIPAALLLPAMTKVPGGYGAEYLMTMTLGICAAENGWLEKCTRQYFSCKFVDKLVKLCLYLFFFVLLYNFRVKSKFLGLADGLVAFCLACFVNEMIADIPVVKTVLKSLGKYSSNMFLIHSLFILYLWPEYLFSLKYGFLILAVLLVGTLVIAYFLEVLKRVSRYQMLTEKILSKLEDKEVLE